MTAPGLRTSLLAVSEPEAVTMPEVRLPPCVGCGRPLPGDDPMDWHLDIRERGWHWSCGT